mgnify:CR=1 FL=1
MSRKYRQSGYQDQGSEERGPRGPRADGQPRPKREGPRGRGLGRPGETVVRCNACGAKVETEEIPIGAACVRCGADLHSCSNCRHFEPSATFECRQPIPQRFPSKSKGNTCELFEPKVTQELGERRGDQDARSAFDALFDL